MENILISSTLILSICSGQIVPESQCGNWVSYNDEKCLRIFNDPGLLDYEDAETYCINEEAQLVSIETQEKQDFIEDFLKFRDIADSVWIGLKFTESSGYEWLDGSEFHYSNWAPGSPKNDSNFCVQIETDDGESWKWSEVLCNKRNIILCEKIQLWSISKIQTELINLKKNIVPVGFIYTQLPKEKLPSDIWPWMTWEDITSDYAGVFFRAEGGNSSSFGEIQEENAPRLAEAQSFNVQSWEYNSNIEINPDGEFSDILLTAVFDDAHYSAKFGINFKLTSGEVRPRNVAIRIWKRTK